MVIATKFPGFAPRASLWHSYGVAKKPVSTEVKTGFIIESPGLGVFAFPGVPPVAEQGMLGLDVGLLCGA
ncbi:hypothetical protein NT6N_14610 [Oceaniferula spumae]|uniref:Uncharacterized protein n=1 Tax=Oceaniferula spumae TaxID=2979115 RepID=A0AAT9FKF6_9BACT